MALDHEIPFTQYLRPDGRTRRVFAPCSYDTFLKATILMDHQGLRFEAEVLTTGEVSLTAHDPIIGEDVGIILSKNGPEIDQKLAELVATVHARYWGEEEENEAQAGN